MESSAQEDRLSTLLSMVFGFAQFRSGQELVCRAALAGHDLLLVMPLWRVAEQRW